MRRTVFSISIRSNHIEIGLLGSVANWIFGRADNKKIQVLWKKSMDVANLFLAQSFISITRNTYSSRKLLHRQLHNSINNVVVIILKSFDGLFS